MVGLDGDFVRELWVRLRRGMLVDRRHAVDVVELGIHTGYLQVGKQHLPVEMQQS